MGENAANRVVQFSCPYRAQPLGYCKWMDPRREQTFIRVDIPQTCQESLVEQQGFHARLALEPRTEFIKADFEGFRTQPGYTRRRTGAPLDPAELAGIVIEQKSVIQREDPVSMLAGLAFQQKFSGHAKVHGEIALVEGDQNEFAAARHRFDAPAG